MGRVRTGAAARGAVAAAGLTAAASAGCDGAALVSGALVNGAVGTDATRAWMISRQSLQRIDLPIHSDGMRNTLWHLGHLL